MDKTNRKNYNKQYYEKNKEKLAEHLYKKIVCDGCGRTCSFQNMKKHKQTALCIGRSKEDKLQEADKIIISMKQEIAALLSIKDDIAKLTARVGNPNLNQLERTLLEADIDILLQKNRQI
jgi:hypothetical protein